MSTHLRALLVEDRVDDVAMVVDTLTQAGFDLEWERVETADGLNALLDPTAWDVVLCDYTIPHFGGEQAIALARRLAPDVPLIIVTGTIGEERLADVIRAGACDFVLKTRLERLAPTIRRELAARQARRDRRELEAQLRHEQDRFRALVEKSADAVAILDGRGCVLYGSTSTERVLGYPVSEFIGRNAFDLVHPCDRPSVEADFAGLVARPEGTFTRELRWWRKGGTCCWSEVSATNLLADASVRGIVMNYRDVTARKQAEAALRESEQRLRLALEGSRAGSWSWDAVTNVSHWDERFRMLYDLDPGAPHAFSTWIERLHPDDRPQLLARLDEIRATPGDDHWEETFRSVAPDGCVRWHIGAGEARRDADGVLTGMAGIDLDITAHKQAEESLREQAAELLARNAELERFNRAAVGRELRMIELKQEINELCRAAGMPDRYDVAAAGEPAVAFAAERPGTYRTS